MYLISAYFDDTANKRIQHLIDRIAKETGNTFFPDHNVPPHMTITSFEARNPYDCVDTFESCAKMLKKGTINIVSPGMLLPYVMYVTPVLNEYLQGLSEAFFEAYNDKDEILISKLYRPFQWLPHITVGKTLNEEQMRKALEVMQKHFTPFKAEVISLGLARTNPHEDIKRVELL